MNTVKVTTANSELVDNTKSTKNKEIEVNKNIVEMKNTGNWEEDFTFGLAYAWRMEKLIIKLLPEDFC